MADPKISSLEIACFNPNSAQIAAESGGCSRIELCKSYSNGGTTPPLQDVITVREFLSVTPRIRVPLHVMIRPRGGDFAYSDTELLEMEESIQQLSPHVDGFVLGVLTADGEVDDGKLRRLVSLARSGVASDQQKTIVFHRAIDELKDPVSALNIIAECGVDYVLSSGGAYTAMEGLDTLKQMVTAAKAYAIEVIVGGGVREGNIAELKRKTGARWFHSAALKTRAVVDGKEEVDGESVLRMHEVLRS